MYNGILMKFTLTQTVGGKCGLCSSSYKVQIRETKLHLGHATSRMTDHDS